MKKVIITGGDGFVGSYAVREFLKNGYAVICIGRAEIPNRIMLQKDLTYIPCDVFNVDEMQSKLSKDEYEAFIHFAWIGSAGMARTDYNLQMKNVFGTVECLKMAKALGCKKFLCAGSIMEYEVEAAIHSQGSRPGMAYIYGMAKNTAHCLCKSVAADIGIELIWPMITNTYGIGEISSRFMATTLQKIIDHEPLRFTSATQNYDFVYVTDVARAFYMIAENGRPFCEYMIGSGKARPLKEFIFEIQRNFAPYEVPLFGNVPFTGINMPLKVFSIEETVRDTGFVPQISFVEGVKMTMEWLKRYREGRERNDTEI